MVAAARQDPHAGVRGAGVDDPLAFARTLMAQGSFEFAESLLRALAADGPAAPALAYLLAVCAVQAGRGPEALIHALRAADGDPAQAPHWMVLGRAARLLGDDRLAALSYRHALARDSACCDAHVGLGLVMKAAGDLDGAIAQYRSALALEADLSAAHANLATALVFKATDAPADAAPDLLDDACAHAARAAALEPGNPRMHANLGALLMQMGRPAQAESALRRAWLLAPDDAAGGLPLARCLVAMARHGPAREVLQDHLRRHPDAIDALNLHAQCSYEIADFTASRASAQRANDLEPNSTSRHHLAKVLMRTGEAEEAVALLRPWLQDDGYAAIATYLMALNYAEASGAALIAEHRRCAGLIVPAAPAASASAAAPPPRRAAARLHVAYLSADLRQHSVAAFMEPILERQAGGRFDITCYHLQPGEPDEVTQRLAALGHRWVNCADLDDDTLARRIQADGVDVLIELTGHAGRSRMPMLARGVAPVQISYLGYPSPTGVPAVPWRITDAIIDPDDGGPDRDGVLRMPASMFCWRPRPSPDVVAPPSTGRGAVTFGTFNNAAKITPAALRCWARVLGAVPGARLLLKDAAFGSPRLCDRFRALLEATGIGAARVQLLPRVPESAHHLALYGEIDVALDTFPYNGATTTCDALWMGVPVVTLLGTSHPCKMGASILTAAGRTAWIAETEDDYVASAVALAARPGERAAWRSDARRVIGASALCNEAAFVQAFDDRIEQAWRTARDGAPRVLAA